jgi:hypothetical protein
VAYEKGETYLTEITWLFHCSWRRPTFSDGYHFCFIFRRSRFQISGRKPATFTKAVVVLRTSPGTFRHSIISRAQSRPSTSSRINYSICILHWMLYVQNEIKASYIHCSISELSVICHPADFHVHCRSWRHDDCTAICRSSPTCLTKTTVAVWYLGRASRLLTDTNRLPQQLRPLLLILHTYPSPGWELRL